MNKLFVITAKGVAMACSVAAGAAVSAFLLQDLLAIGVPGEIATPGPYASLISDCAASLMAGSLIGWLVYFCLWDCLANWLYSLWACLKSKPQLNGEANQPHGVEQTG